MLCVLHQLPAGTPQYARQRDHVIERCLPLADHIAHRYSGRGESREDLIQVARLGLIQAVNRFDEHAGSEFLSFAVPTIMGEVKRYFRDSGWSLSIPRRLKDIHQHLGATTADLAQQLGRAPTASELAEAMGLPRRDVVEALVAAGCYRTVSIDSPVSGDSELTGIAERLGGCDSALDHVENWVALRPLIAALSPRERTILMARFFEGLTQTEIADRIGISQMHVSRLLSQSLEQLRQGLCA